MSDAYRDYLKKYCKCQSPICQVKPKVIATGNKSEEPSDIVESQKGVKPLLLITQQRVEVAKFKKRLRKLDRDLAKCDKP